MSVKNNAATDIEVVANQELKQLAFDKFRIPLRGRDVFVWYRGRPIVSSFDRHDLSITYKEIGGRGNRPEINQALHNLFY